MHHLLHSTIRTVRTNIEHTLDYSGIYWEARGPVRDKGLAALQAITELDTLLETGSQVYALERDVAVKAVKELKKTVRAVSSSYFHPAWQIVCHLESIMVSAQKADDMSYR